MESQKSHQSESPMRSIRGKFRYQSSILFLHPRGNFLKNSSRHLTIEIREKDNAQEAICDEVLQTVFFPGRQWIVE